MLIDIKNNKSKWFFVFIGFTLPLIIEYLNNNNFSKYVYLAMPGLLLTIFFKVTDLEKSIQKELKFFQQISNSKYTVEITEIVASLTNINTKKDMILNRVVENKIADIKHELNDIQKDAYYIRDENDLATLPIEMMDNVKHELCATLLWREDTLFEGIGAAYIQSMHEAIDKRDVIIKRLYIINEKDLENDHILIERMRSDLQHKVKVCYIFETDLKETKIDGISSIDFGIWDSDRVWVYNNKVYNKTNNGKRSAIIYNDKDRIDRYKLVFSTNWNSQKTIKFK